MRITRKKWLELTEFMPGENSKNISKSNKKWAAWTEKVLSAPVPESKMVRLKIRS